MNDVFGTSEIYARDGRRFAVGEPVSILGGSIRYAIVAVDQDSGLARLVREHPWSRATRDVIVDNLQHVI